MTNSSESDETTPTDVAPEITVVLPAHNEVMLIGSTVTNLVTGLEERRRNFELLVVENGSSDGTLRLSRLIAAQLPAVRVLSLPRPDYGAALSLGLKSARGSIVVTFDVDYFDLAFFDRAFALVDAREADIVLASKRAAGSVDRRPLVRRALTAGFAAVVERALELEVSDAHGMKVMRADSVRPFVNATVSRGSLFDVELVARAMRSGLAVTELPVVVRELRPPRSSVLGRAVESGLGLVRLRLILRRPPEGVARRAPRRSASAAAGRASSSAASLVRLLRSARSWWVARSPSEGPSRSRGARSRRP